MEEQKEQFQIVCKNCGARYDHLPAFTCPRCGDRLCPSGCEECSKHCGLVKKRTSKG